MTTLVTLMRSPKAPPATRIAAAREILDRGHGKLQQALTGPDGTAAVAVTVIHQLLPECTV